MRSTSPVAGISSVVGQEEVCTEPSFHQLQTSSVTKGRNGANSRSMTSRARRSAVRALSAPALSAPSES